MPVRANSKSEDRRLIADRRRLPIQIKAILAESVYVAGKIGGAQDALRVIEQEFHGGSFERLEFFGAAAFLATDTDVFRIDPWPELDSAMIVANSEDRYTQLTAGGGGCGCSARIMRP